LIKNPGRTKKMTDRDIRRLALSSKKNPFFVARDVYNDTKGLPDVSISTVKRMLRSQGLFGRVAAKKPLISEKNRRKRLAWCKSYLSLDAEMWRKIVFSDESKVELFSSRRRFVRRRIGQRFEKQFVCRTVKGGGFSLMVWGCIKGDGSKMLYRCPRILNSDSYQNILSAALIPFLDGDSIFMHDGAPCHRSASTQKYIDKRHICAISDWPPQSPDINIIESLWSILKDKLVRREPKTKEDLWKILLEEWERIDREVIKKLYDSIPSRLKAIIKCKGLHTKY